jgi:hypothetical protein
MSPTALCSPGALAPRGGVEADPSLVSHVGDPFGSQHRRQLAEHAWEAPGLQAARTRAAGPPAARADGGSAPDLGDEVGLIDHTCGLAAGDASGRAGEAGSPVTVVSLPGRGATLGCRAVPHCARRRVDIPRNHPDPLNTAGAPSHKAGGAGLGGLKVGNGLHSLLGTEADTFKQMASDDRSCSWLRQPLRTDRAATAPGSQM